MSKKQDIHKVLIIGSGPIIIGQACEFDYSGTQACKALKKLGYEIVLVNSNPATIMTDPGTADVTYIEPLNLERLTQIACMGTTKLKTCFKKYYDCTITEYIQQRRMSQAEYLLAYTELTVGQVAQTVGYSTSSRFAELFRKSTGLLPLEYRKTAQRK